MNEDLSDGGCFHHKSAPQILYSGDGSLISLRDPGLCLFGIVLHTM